MQTNFELSNVISNHIVAIVKDDTIDKKQIKPQILPIISNQIFAYETELLEIERFNTLIKLARVLDDTNLQIAIKALNYTLAIK